MRAPAIAALALVLAGGAAAAPAAESGVQLDPGMSNPGHLPHPEWFKQSFLDLNEDLEEAAAEDRLVMLYVYQDGCPYCRLFVENDLGQHDIADYMQRHFDMIAINMFGALEVTDVDGEALPEAAFVRKAGVMFTPTLLAYEAGRGQVFRMNGYYPPPRLRLAARYLAERRYRDQSFATYAGGADAPASSGRLHLEDATLEGPPFDLSRRDPERPLLALFEQQRCLACDELHQDIFRRPDTRALLERFEIAVLDIRSADPMVSPEGAATTSLDWARAQRVKVAPTLVVYDAGGAEAIRSEGYLKAFHVQSILDYVASGAHRTTPDFQRYLQARSVLLQEQGIEIDLME